jgi:hypothetical protein
VEVKHGNEEAISICEFFGQRALAQTGHSPLVRMRWRVES